MAVGQSQTGLLDGTPMLAIVLSPISDAIRSPWAMRARRTGRTRMEPNSNAHPGGRRRMETAMNEVVEEAAIAHAVTSFR